MNYLYQKVEELNIHILNYWLQLQLHFVVTLSSLLFLLNTSGQKKWHCLIEIL